MDWNVQRVRVLVAVVVVVFSIFQAKHAYASMHSRLSGRILLQVEARGEAWYVNPVDQKRYFLGRPGDAFQLMRSLGLGITNVNLAKIPEAASTGQGDQALRRRLSGRILLQVESRGEAWYVNPITLRRHLLGRPSDAFQLMRSLGLGITNANLQLIAPGQLRGGPASSPLFSRLIRAPRSPTRTTCDTDGGVNIYEAGTVTTTKKGTTTILTDTCVDEKLLYEQYCIRSGLGGGTTTIHCLGSCVSGACTRTFDATKCKSFGPVSARAEEEIINLVIVGAGYSNVEEFIPWVKNNFAATFFLVEPWKSHQDAFNFYYVDAVAPFDQGSFSTHEALSLAEHCQKTNKVTVSVVNKNFRDSGSLLSVVDQMLTKVVGSATLSAPYVPAHTDSKGNFQPTRPAILTPYIIAHELGHSIGGLRDEYVEEGIAVGSELLGKSLGPNCFSQGAPTTVAQCLAEAPWKDLIPVFPTSVGCFEGCNYRSENIYRPSEHGIMSDGLPHGHDIGGVGYDISKVGYDLQLMGLNLGDVPDHQRYVTYGLAEERSICCQILGKTGSVGGYCNLFNQAPLNLVEYCQQEFINRL